MLRENHVFTVIQLLCKHCGQGDVCRHFISLMFACGAAKPAG